MTSRTLIVARMTPGAATEVGRLFTESDRTELPRALGVKCRQLYQYHNLYFHYVEFHGDADAAIHTARERSDFAQLSGDLNEYIHPFDPTTWRGPADAMAHEFYSWTCPDGGAR